MHSVFNVVFSAKASFYFLLFIYIHFIPINMSAKYLFVCLYC